MPETAWYIGIKIQEEEWKQITHNINPDLSA